MRYRTCGVESRRQNLYFAADRQTTLFRNTTNDHLPIVELKPFTQREWRREKSFPSFHVAKSLNGDDFGEYMQQETPRACIQSIVSNPEANDRKVDIFSGKSNVIKSRTKLHPQPEVTTSSETKHSLDLIPGFITRGGRSKTTLDEIKVGCSQSRLFSCKKDVLTPADVACQQRINISGLRMKNNSKKRQLNYLKPFSYYKHPDAWTLSYSDENSKVTYKKGTRNNFKTEACSPFQGYRRTAKVASFRAKTSPLSENPHNPSHRQNSPIYRIGGIKNSLQLLNSMGHPTNVEKQLSYELDINLRHFRKTKSYPTTDLNIKGKSKGYSPYGLHLTQGEVMIRKGQISNFPVKNKKSSSKLAIESASQEIHDKQTDSGIQSRMDENNLDDFASEEIKYEDMKQTTSVNEGDSEIKYINAIGHTNYLDEADDVILYDTNGTTGRPNSIKINLQMAGSPCMSNARSLPEQESIYDRQSDNNSNDRENMNDGNLENVTSDGTLSNDEGSNVSKKTADDIDNQPNIEFEPLSCDNKDQNSIYITQTQTSDIDQYD